MTRRLTPIHLLVSFVKALLIAGAILYLAEYFGWPLVRDAGGTTVSARGLSGR